MDPETKQWYEQAIKNYEMFYNLPEGIATLQHIQSTPQDINGWAAWKPGKNINSLIVECKDPVKDGPPKS